MNITPNTDFGYIFHWKVLIICFIYISKLLWYLIFTVIYWIKCVLVLILNCYLFVCQYEHIYLYYDYYSHFYIHFLQITFTPIANQFCKKG